MQEPGQEDGSQSWNAAEAGVQLLSEDNLAGGMEAPREGKG